MPTFVRLPLPLLLLAVILAVLAASAPTPATAGPLTFTVNVADNLVQTGDGVCDSHCTLRDAIEEANAVPGSDTIVFDPDNAPYNLVPHDTFEIDASDGVVIDGSAGVVLENLEMPDGYGFYLTSVPGEDIEQVTIRNMSFSFFQDYVIRVCADPDADECTGDIADVTLENLTLSTNPIGNISIEGVDISDLTITNVDIADSSDINAFGIYVRASGELNDVTVQDSSVQNTGHNGISLSGEAATNLLIQDNTITNTYGVGVGASDTLTNPRAIDNTITDSIGNGLSINGFPVVSPVVSGNTVTGTQGQFGIFMQGDTTDGVIEDNVVTGAGELGILLNAAGGNVIRRNTVSGAGEDGIYLSGQAIISRNSTYNNGQLGIDLNGDDTDPGVTPNDPGDIDGDAFNALLNFPVITSANAQTVNGTVCAGCLVELFISDDDPSGHGEGVEFINDGTANGAEEFSVSICEADLLPGDKVTATATDTLGNSSEFSLNFTINTAPGDCPATPTPTSTPTPTPTSSTSPSETPTPTATAETPTPAETSSMTATPTSTATPSPTPTISPSPSGGPPVAHGDLDCDGEVSSRDNQALLREVLDQTVLSQTEPCPDLGSPLGGGPPAIAGDLDCDGEITSRDNQALLRKVLDQPPLSQTEPCPDIGES